MFTKYLHIHTQMPEVDKALLALLIQNQLSESEEIKLSKQTVYNIQAGKRQRKVQLSNSIFKRTRADGHVEYLVTGDQTDSKTKQNSKGKPKHNSSSRHVVKSVNYILTIDEEGKLQIELGDEIIKADQFTREATEPYKFDHDSASRFSHDETKYNSFSKWRHAIVNEQQLTNEINPDANCQTIFRSKHEGASYYAKAYITMKRYEGQTLDQVASDKLTLSERLYIALEYLKQLQAMHEKEIIYADPKAANTILDSRGLTLKLIDFDHTRRTGEVRKIAYTLNYCAPELASGNKNNTVASDIFAAAACVAEALTCPGLFDNRKAYHRPEDVAKQPFNFDNLLAGYRYQVSPEHLRSLQYTLRKMSEQSPGDRCSLNDDFMSAIRTFERLHQHYLRKDFEALDAAVKASVTEYKKRKTETKDENKQTIIQENIGVLNKRQTEIADAMRDTKLQVSKYRQLRQQIDTDIDSPDIAKALGHNSDPVRRFFNKLSKYMITPILRLVHINIENMEHGLMPEKSLRIHKQCTQPLRDCLQSNYTLLAGQKRKSSSRPHTPRAIRMHTSLTRSH